MSVATIEPNELGLKTDTGHEIYWKGRAELGGLIYHGNKAMAENVVSENSHGLLLVALNVDDEGYDEVYTESRWGRDGGEGSELRRTTDLEIVERAIEALTNLRDALRAASR